MHEVKETIHKNIQTKLVKVYVLFYQILIYTFVLIYYETNYSE